MKNGKLTTSLIGSALATSLLSSCVDVSAQKAAGPLPIVEVRAEPAALYEVATRGAAHGHRVDLVLTLSNLAEELRQHNPQLAAARKLIQEAEGRLAQSGLKENPELEIEFETDRKMREVMLTVGVSQRFPRANRLLLEKRVSGILVDAARAEVREVERQLRGEAMKIMVEVMALREEEALLREQEKNLLALAEFTKSVAERGEGSLLESTTARIESVRLGNRARQVFIGQGMAMAKLKPLVGLSPQSELRIGSELRPAELPPLVVANSKRPDLRAAYLRAQSAQEEISLEESRRKADWVGGVFAGLGRKEDAPDGLESEQVMGLRFSIPLPIHNNNQGAIDEAKARYERLSQEANALGLQIAADAAASYQEMQQWKMLINEVDGQLLPLAQENVKLTQQAYERGESELQEVLRAREQEISLKTTRLEALRDFNLALANYNTSLAQ